MKWQRPPRSYGSGHRAESGAGERPYWKTRDWMLSAGFLSAVVLIAVATRAGDPDRGASGGPLAGQPPRVAAPLSSDVPDPTADGEGGEVGEENEEPDGDADAPRPPDDLRWEAVGRTLVPVSDSVGPTRGDGGVRAGFAHSPMGAVLAAHVVSAALGQDTWRETARLQMLPGPNRDVFVRERVAAGDPPGQGPPASYAGFSVLHYTAEEATVHLLIRLPEGGYTATSLSMAWQDGDWKLAPRSDGSLTSPFIAVLSSDGFALWRG
ncbi:hypothetical protein ACIQMR_12005 [Streptomyces sp. NPDC091376]|uniref:hypothetical protein n=1 Tax=Streptomyces sp. NPDC091376 TaxID=3365994 RepID=UPI003805F216